MQDRNHTLRRRRRGRTWAFRAHGPPARAAIRRFGFFRARELFGAPLSNTFRSPLRGAPKSVRKRRNRRRRRTCLLGARWRKRWCEIIRGMRSSSTTRSYSSSSSTWRRGLLAVKAHPAVTGHMTRRSCSTARPLHSQRVSSVRESMQHWRLSTPPPSRAATRRDTLRRSQHR